MIQENVINILVGVKTIRLTRDFVNLPTTRGLLVIETRGRALDRRWKEATIQIPKFYITQSTIHTTHKYIAPHTHTNTHIHTHTHKEREKHTLDVLH